MLCVFFDLNSKVFSIRFFAAICHKGAFFIYILIDIVKKRINIKSIPYSTLQILSVSLFMKQSINQAVVDIDMREFDMTACNQLILCE